MAHFENTRDFAGAVSEISFGLKGLWQNVKQRMANGVKQVQFARMTGVLQSMSDEQLAQVGITRAEIPQQAAMLVGLER